MTEKQSRKLLYCSPTIWRKIFLFKSNPIFKTGEKFIYARSSIIPRALSNFTVNIHSGKKWHTRNLTKWSIGFKFGEFTWNKRSAAFKAKQLKKKKK